MKAKQQRRGKDGPAKQVSLLSKSLRVNALIVPAAIGFLLAFVVVITMGPYESTIELLAWSMISITVALATSMIAGDYVQRAIKASKAYAEVQSFDTEVDSLFGTYLREGNERNLRKESAALGYEAQFVEEVKAKLDALNQHDRMTQGHLDRVRGYASLLGIEIGLSQSELELLNWTAMFHDIGKLQVSEDVLNTTRSLNTEDWQQLRGHTQAADLHLVAFEPTLGPGIYDGSRYHHERWNGEGYPAGLSQGEIPLLGRVTAIADAFDVMTNARSYKPAISISEARTELMASAGTHFDPDLVTAFLRIEDAKLKDVLGWSTTIGGITLAKPQATRILTNVAVAAMTLFGAGTAVAMVPDAFPESIAFVDLEVPVGDVELNQTNPLPSRSENSFELSDLGGANQLPADSATDETSSPAPASSGDPSDLITVNYSIPAEVLALPVNPDELLVFVNDELHSTHPLGPGQRLVPVQFGLDALAEGMQKVRFELKRQEQIVSESEVVLAE